MKCSSGHEHIGQTFCHEQRLGPQYLREVVAQDFYNMELLAAAEGASNAQYCLVMEDISLDDQTLYETVQQIEHE